jgi:hypothetical protein
MPLCALLLLIRYFISEISQKKILRANHNITGWSDSISSFSGGPLDKVAALLPLDQKSDDAKKCQITEQKYISRTNQTFL